MRMATIDSYSFMLTLLCVYYLESIGRCGLVGGSMSLEVSFEIESVYIIPS